MKKLFNKNKKIKFAVAFKEIGCEDIQVDIMDFSSLCYLSIDWAFEILAIKEI